MSSGHFGNRAVCPRLGLWGRAAFSATIVASLLIGARETTAQDPDPVLYVRGIQEVFIRTIKQVEPCVVSIARERIQDDIIHRNPFAEPIQQPGDVPPADHIPNEFGAGLIVGADGLILTNYHVVKGGPVVGMDAAASGQRLWVRLADRRAFPAFIFAADPRSDFAVLKIDAQNLPVVKWPDPEKLTFEKGQMLLALGNPYAIARDGSASVSWGILANIGRRADLPPVDDDERKTGTIHQLGTLLQLDMRLDLGTSGGPVMNLDGEVIGITTSLAAIAGFEKSSGFAVPIDKAMRRIIDTLIEGHEVEYGLLGVNSPVPVDATTLSLYADEFGQNGGVRFQGIIDRSPAAKLDRGDVILKVGSRQVLTPDDLIREIGLCEPGFKVTLTYWSEKRRKVETLQTVLGKWPAPDEQSIIGRPRRDRVWRGMVIDYTTARNQHLPDPLTRWPDGVRVLSVAPESRAAEVTKEFSQNDAPLDNTVRAGDLVTDVMVAGRGWVRVTDPASFARAVAEGQGRPVKLRFSQGTAEIPPE